MKTFARLWKYRAELLLTLDMHQKKCGKTQSTHSLVNNFFLKIVPFMR
jgi:hypothetical protein